MKAEKWITELNPEDLVIVHRGGYSKRRSVGKVVRISKTGWITVSVPEERREIVFLPSGFQRGGGGGYHSKALIRPFDPEEGKKIEQENKHVRMTEKLGGMSWRDWQGLPFETVQKVYALVCEAQSDKKEE